LANEDSMVPPCAAIVLFPSNLGRSRPNRR
jgi:hypothetical protein